MTTSEAEVVTMASSVSEEVTMATSVAEEVTMTTRVETGDDRGGEVAAGRCERLGV